MNFDALWQTFTETGDPMGYLLFRAAESTGRPERETKGTGDDPRPAD